MDWTDWVGLWAALQVIETILAVALVVVLILIGIVYLVGGTILDEWKAKRRRKDKS